MFYNSDLEFDHPDFETRRINDVYHCVLLPHVIVRLRVERAAERLARYEFGSEQVLKSTGVPGSMTRSSETEIRHMAGF